MSPADPTLFIGRQRELAELSKLLGPAEGKPVLVSGMGGMGKTALVSRFVHQEYADDRVAWLSFYSERETQQALDKLRDRLHAAPPGTAPEIVVLDDVDEASLDLVAQFLVQLQSSAPKLPVILTSRHLIDVIDSNRIALDALSTEDAVAVLGERLGATQSNSQLEELAKTLGNHPLALAIAGGLARERPVGELIKELQETIYELERDEAREEASFIEIARPRIVSAGDLLAERLRSHPEEIFKIPPRRFEELVASLLDDMGWEVHLTQQTRDGGRDILAYLTTDAARLLCLVETKRYDARRPVGVELVRNLCGTLCDEQANSALLVTTSYFTPDARDFQRRHVYQIGLKDYKDVVRWIGRYKRSDGS